VSRHSGRLRASIQRWATQSGEEARELRSSTERSGCRQVQQVRDRDRCELEGVLKTVTLRPRGGVPALEAELYDGTGSVTLIWLGRRRITGIEPGRTVRVEGRVGVHEDVRMMFNPRYDLRAS
jgi:hypothetical protein